MTVTTMTLPAVHPSFRARGPGHRSAIAATQNCVALVPFSVEIAATPFVENATVATNARLTAAHCVSSSGFVRTVVQRTVSEQIATKSFKNAFTVPGTVAVLVVFMKARGNVKGVMVDAPKCAANRVVAKMKWIGKNVIAAKVDFASIATQNTQMMVIVPAKTNLISFDQCPSSKKRKCRFRDVNVV